MKKEFNETELDLISEMSQDIADKEQHIRSLYIWIGILGVASSMLSMLLIFGN